MIFSPDKHFYLFLTNTNLTKNKKIFQPTDPIFFGMLAETRVFLGLIYIMIKLFKF